MQSSLRSRGVSGRKPGAAHAKKERELAARINKAEKRQLDEFLRTRTAAVDRDIKDLRSRLYVEGPGRGDQLGYGELMHPRGPTPLGRADLRVSGVGSPSKNKQATVATTVAAADAYDTMVQRPVGARPADTRQMDFLQRLNDAVYDSGLRDDQIYALLYPGSPRGESTVPLRLLVEILQLDLVLPVSRDDQVVLTHHYGVTDGGRVTAKAVDALRLFRDAGVNLAPPIAGADSGRATHAHPSQLKELLQRLSDAISRAGVSDDEVPGLLGLSPGETTLPLQDFIYTLEMEVLRLTPADEALLARHYDVGASNSVATTVIDIARLFRDAGITWAPPPGARVDWGLDVGRAAHANTAPHLGGDIAAPSPYALRPETVMGVEEDDSDLDTDAERRARTARGHRGADRFVRTDAGPRKDSREEHNRDMPPAAKPQSAHREYSATNEVYVGVNPRGQLGSGREEISLEDEMASKNVDMLRDMHELVRATEERGKPALPVEDPDEQLLDSIIAKYKHLEPPSTVAERPASASLSRTPTEEERLFPTSFASPNSKCRTDGKTGARAPNLTGEEKSAEAMNEKLNDMLHSLGKEMGISAEKLKLALNELKSNPTNVNEPSNQNAAHGDEGAPDDDHRRSIERLAQNTRRDLRAMERAGLLDEDEPFPRRPPHSAARTSRAPPPSSRYGRGAGGNGDAAHRGGGAAGHHGDAGTSYSLRVPNSDKARSYHTSLISETGEPTDGSFSDLCERRLVFEITNSRHPVETFRSLLHTVMDAARSNGCRHGNEPQAAALKDADPTHVPPAPKEVHYGFVTAVQLFHVCKHLGLLLSIGEIELIAAGFASDGCGGFNASEFCEALQDLMYATDNSFLLDNGGSGSRQGSERGMRTGGSERDHRFSGEPEGYDSREKYGSQSRGIAHGRHNNKRSDIGGGGLNVSAELNDYWMIVEFEFVDDLLNQLEALSPSDRRRRLLSLRHLLWAAEANNELLRPSNTKSRTGYMSDEYLLEDTDTPSGEVEREVLDGFTLLKCLVNSGFEISRYKRSYFLSAVEELGGRIRYTELCNILMSGCADWPAAEQGLTAKILKAMGPTVPQRRVWLARLREDVNSVALADHERVQEAQNGGHRGSKYLSSQDRTGSSVAADPRNPGIPASSFLHILRELGTGLSIDEEATLLDCLDLERHAELVAMETSLTGGSSLQKMSLLSEMDRDGSGIAHGLEGNLKAPLVFYKSFLAFCNRHSGDWTMFLPDLYNKLKRIITSGIDGVFNDVLELKSLFLSFDDTSSGVISKRSFLVSCHRSNIFSKLSEQEVTQLTEVLSADSGGSVDYRLFVYYLQSLALVGKGEGTAREQSGVNTSPGSYRILSQLLDGGSAGDGTLTPLRAWLSRALREESNESASLLAGRELIAQLLRDFGVVYEEVDFLQFLQELSLTSATLKLDEVSNQLISKRSFTAPGYGPETVDVRSLFFCLFKVRGDWTNRQPVLCDKIRRCFAAAPEGAARRLLTRLNSFSAPAPVPLLRHMALARSGEGPDDWGSQGGRASSMAVMDAGDAKSRVVRREVFLHVVQACGMPLNEDDIYVLADATDLSPFADFVAANDALLSPLKEKHSPSSVVPGHRAALTKRQEHSEEGKSFAVKHFRSQLAKAALQQKRTPLQWQSDVYSVFTGFDRGGGFVTGADFKAAINILGVNVSYDLLSGLVSKDSVAFSSADLIDYEQVLDDVFDDLSASEAVAGSDRRVLDDLDTSESGRRVHRGGTGQVAPGSPHGKHSAGLSRADPIKRKYAGSAVKALVTVVRRGMEKFIVNGNDIEDVCVDLVNVFKKFDGNKDGLISARDFCLGVSILLGGDDVVFDKAEWEEVINYFSVNSSDEEPPSRFSSDLSPTRNRTQGAGKGPAMVNYVDFIETILDSSQLREIKTRVLSRDPKSHGGMDTARHATTGTRSAKRHEPHTARASRGATVSFTSPDLFTLDSMSAQQSTRPQSTVLRKTTTGRYHSTTGRGSGNLYSPVVGGSDARRSGTSNLSPKGRSSFGSSKKATDGHANKVVGDAKEDVKLTQKQFTKAKQLKFGNQELRALEDLKVNVSEALDRRPIPKGKSKADVLRDWLDMEDTNRSGSLSKNSVIATLNALGLPYESWSTPSQRNLVDFLAARGGGTVMIDDLMALIGAKL